MLERQDLDQDPVKLSLLYIQTVFIQYASLFGTSTDHREQSGKVETERISMSNKGEENQSFK